jgi:hypothetical protein
MAATYRTANGKLIDIDALRLANEGVIAVGNMRTNARGDELGAGGHIVKTKAQLMQEYHKLNTPVINHTPVGMPAVARVDDTPVIAPVVKTKAPVVEDAPAPTVYVKPRGSFAGAVATETEVNQVLLDPQPGVTPGVKRI